MKKKDVIAVLSAGIEVVTLGKFAEHLIGIQESEVNKLAAILEEEYGITIKKPEQVAVVSEISGKDFEIKKPKIEPILIKKKTKKRDYFVPKKLGNVCSKPKNRF